MMSHFRFELLVDSSRDAMVMIAVPVLMLDGNILPLFPVGAYSNLDASLEWTVWLYVASF